MDSNRFRSLARRYSDLKIAVLGDFCLDRYLEIDPEKKEISIETSLPVYNVVRVRAQAGGAGTILNNLAALGLAALYPIGFLGEDGEGFELSQSLARLPGVHLEGMLRTNQRRTFTYCKPLLVSQEGPPQELNRLDSKNWSVTPREVEAEMARLLRELAKRVDAIIVLDQVDLPETGVVTRHVLEVLAEIRASSPRLLVLADSRRGLADFPPAVFKMNVAELSRRGGVSCEPGLDAIKDAAGALARKNRELVFVTMAERGIVGAAPNGDLEHLPSLPIRGPIDVVGAGDAVSANLTVALAAGASLREAVEIATAAASVVIHKLGTTGTAAITALEQALGAT